MDETKTFPFISIVICTLNRRRLLRDCLNSILKMEYPKSRYEMIIVDGGSTDGTEELCKDFSEIRFITEGRFGLAYARNKGAELARGSIVAYTDDDCVVDVQWLRSLVSGFHASKAIVGVGGPVYPLHPEIIPRKILVKAALGLYSAGQEVKPVQCIITSNSAFKTEIFDSIRFDEALGVTRRGRRILSGEDVDFCQTLVASGIKLLYTPYAKVYHQISTDRLKVAYILRRSFEGGIGEARILLKKRNSRIWAFRYAVGRLVQSIFQILSDRSFTSCYVLINSLSALFVCFTGLDKVL
ncbi:MAG TPA: glycosyltransferase [Candidatus Bathyarchaeia archaeon]|nr:glycosyltransferase [Candidatus Bathyarchaeia archaeon]